MGRLANSNCAVYVFRNDSGLLALTGDPEGSSLPQVDGPWHFVKTASLRGDRDDERHALNLIGLYGFCCFSEHPGGNGEP